MSSQINSETQVTRISETNKRKFFIKTLGCKVNQYESQAIREILTRSGFTECLTKDIADIYILNTCTVTSKADKESRYWLGLFHRTNPKADIVVTGCYVENNSDDISFLPGVSYIIMNEEKPRIADILNGISAKKRSKGTDSPYNFLTITDFKNHTKAFVKIQDGCDNRCSYCKVPLVRGSLRSRPITSIIEEVEILAEKGFKEIVLTGICLGAWGKDPYMTAITNGWPGAGSALSLVDALKAIDKISADFRVRLSSIEPKYIADDLIDFIAGTKRMCRHLHIPLQSGDDDILRRMNRPYTAKEYRALIDKIRSKIKDVALTTDVMIGFPGESEANFKNTENFLRDILPARTHIFTFSERKGTAAYGMSDILTRDILKKRYSALEVVALSASYLYRQKFLGATLNILAETRRDKYTGFLEGYSDNYIKVFFEGPDSLMRKIVPVKIEDLNLAYTRGVYVST